MKASNTKEVKKVKINLLGRLLEKGGLSLLRLFLNVLFGFIFAGAQITEKSMPFGFSLVSALPIKDGIFAFIGVIAGHFITAYNENAVRYIAQCLVIIAIKWAFAAFFENEGSWGVPVSAGAVNLAVGSLMLISRETTVYDVVMLVSECVICAGAVYFIERLVTVGSRGGVLKTPENIAALSVFIALSLISLSRLRIGFISVGHLIAAYCVMASAYSLGIVGGACTGLSIGAALSVSALDGGFLIMALSLGGMLSGLFSKISRYAVTLIFLLCALLSIVVSGTGENNLYLLYESISASVLFLLTPEKLFSKIMYFFPSIENEGEIYPNKYLSARLDFVSKALVETSETVSKISDKLIGNYGGSMEAVFRCAADRVCRRCSMKLTCWDTMYEDTMDSLNHIAPILKRQGILSIETFPELLRQRCIKSQSLICEINSAYCERMKRKSAVKRARQIKDIVSQQFSGISKLLCDLSQELALTMCDKETEVKLNREFIKDGIYAEDISCPVDKFGRKTVEFYCLSKEITKITSTELEECISEICNTPMQQSGTLNTQDITRLTFSEKMPFKIETASFQHIKEGEKVCGDSFDLSPLPNGFSAVILSDGMGQGKSAAVDSKMTVSLVKRFLSLGFTVENSLSLVNSSLMLKSQDETLSTLDVAIFDLYVGSVSIKKAGAAPSFVKRGKRISKIEMESLPLGILNESESKSATLKLSRGDILVMCSDGMCTLYDDEIEKILKQSEDKSLEQIANELGNKALEKGSMNDDDITVLVSRIS